MESSFAFWQKLRFEKNLNHRTPLQNDKYGLEHYRYTTIIYSEISKDRRLFLYNSISKQLPCKRVVSKLRK